MIARPSQPQTADTRYTLSSVTLSDLGANLSSILGQIGRLDINGHMQVNGSVVLSPSDRPTTSTLARCMSII